MKKFLFVALVSSLLIVPVNSNAASIPCGNVSFGPPLSIWSDSSFFSIKGWLPGSFSKECNFLVPSSAEFISSIDTSVTFISPKVYSGSGSTALSSHIIEPKKSRLVGSRTVRRIIKKINELMGEPLVESLENSGSSLSVTPIPVKIWLLGSVILGVIGLSLRNKPL